MNDLYSILECESNVTHADMKRQYQKLILKYHPDKSVEASVEQRTKFLQVVDAWKILGDSEKRKQYDAQYFSSKIEDSPIIYDVIDVKDLIFDEDSKLSLYNCRCGGHFEIFRDDVNGEDTHISCNECSLAVLVKVS